MILWYGCEGSLNREEVRTSRSRVSTQTGEVLTSKVGDSGKSPGFSILVLSSSAIFFAFPGVNGTYNQMTTSASESPWLTSPNHDALVSLGTHSLHLNISVPPRSTPSQPLVILEAGLGCSLSEWLPTARLISPFARVLAYSRSGYGRSESAPPDFPPTCANRALELRSVLRRVDLEPPYLLVGHSHGGIIIREFLEQFKNEVAGMVFVDALPLNNVPDLPDSIWSLCPGELYLEVVGLKGSHIFKADEWAAIEADNVKSAKRGAIKAELDVGSASQNAINTAQGAVVGESGEMHFSARPLTGGRRMSVILGSANNDFRKMYEYGIKHGNGTMDEREEVSAWLKKWGPIFDQRKLAVLELAEDGGESRMVQAKGVGKTHNVHWTQPWLVAQEVKWVLEG